MMTILPVKNMSNYETAIEHIHELMDAERGTPEDDGQKNSK